MQGSEPDTAQKGIGPFARVLSLLTASPSVVLQVTPGPLVCEDFPSSNLIRSSPLVRDFTRREAKKRDMRNWVIVIRTAICC